MIAGKVVIESQELNLSEVIEAAVESVAPAARARNIRILITGGRGIGTVMADRTRLQQVFWNLLSNAVKFSAPDSRVVVRSERFADEAGMKTQVLIHVEDSGKGIDQDFLRDIFNPFSQEDSSSARLHGGLGLGLAIVKNLVELQGGTVEARNRSEGKGAVFTVRLPLKSEFKLAARSDPSARPDGATVALDGRWVLIVDNDARAGFALGEVLRSSGARADLVDSAAAALAFLEVGVPDVLVSEIALHGADGYALIRQIRSLPADRGGEIPALAVTVFAGHEDKERALAAGFDAHLAKPVEARRLAETIRDLAARSRR